jgi:excisionase family DNA binding protein
VKTEKAPCPDASPFTQTLSTSGDVKVFEGWVTRELIAAHLSVDPRTIDRWVRGGLIPFIKIGTGRNSPIRFRRSAVDEAVSKGIR